MRISEYFEQVISFNQPTVCDTMAIASIGSNTDTAAVRLMSDLNSLDIFFVELAEPDFPPDTFTTVKNGRIFAVHCSKPQLIMRLGSIGWNPPGGVVNGKRVFSLRNWTIELVEAPNPDCTWVAA